MNYVLYDGDLKVSAVLTEEEASRRVRELSKTGMFKNLHMRAVDEIVEEKVTHGPAEVVEELNCAGGACKL